MRWPEFGLTIALGIAGCRDAAPHEEDVAADPPVPSVAEKAVPAPSTSLRTSRPSKSTRQILAGLEGLEVVTFFVPGPVQDQVFGYFSELGVEIREVDHVAEPRLAKQLRVRDNGTIALRVADQVQRVSIPEGQQKAQRRLPQLDHGVGMALRALSDLGTAVVIHPEGKPATAIESILNSVVTRVVNRSASTTEPLPKGTTIVLHIDDGVRPIAAGFAGVAAHIEAGGNAFIALEPAPSPEVAEVLGPRGVAFDPTVLASETSFLVVNNDSTDHANLATDSFGTHPAVQSLARTTRKSAVAFLGTGSFEPASGSSDPPATLVKTRPDAFADQNGNLRLDPPDEAPAEHDLAVAVERGHSRIALFADASWLDQRALGTLKANQVMLFGTLQWLAGDEPDPEESAADPQLVAYPLRPIPGG